MGNSQYVYNGQHDKHDKHRHGRRRRHRHQTDRPAIPAPQQNKPIETRLSGAFMQNLDSMLNIPHRQFPSANSGQKYQQDGNAPNFHALQRFRQWFHNMSTERIYNIPRIGQNDERPKRYHINGQLQHSRVSGNSPDWNNNKSSRDNNRCTAYFPELCNMYPQIGEDNDQDTRPIRQGHHGVSDRRTADNPQNRQTTEQANAVLVGYKDITSLPHTPPLYHVDGMFFSQHSLCNVPVNINLRLNLVGRIILISPPYDPLMRDK